MRASFTQCVSSGMCPPQCPPSVMPPGPNQGPPPGPGPGLGPGPGPGPGSDPFYPPPFSPYTRRVNPYNSTDYRIYELNKRLQHKPEDCDNVFWDNLATDFFEDDAVLTLVLCLEDGMKRFSIGRTLIPRYFRSLYDGDVTDVSFNLKNPKESYQPNLITMDCDQCSMITFHGRFNVNKGMNNFPPGADPQQVKEQLQLSKDTTTVVTTEGRLTLEFTYDDLMRIKSWNFTSRSYQELVPRNTISMLAQQDQSALEQFSKNITRQGFTGATLNYLRLCLILEPMQELMARHKSFALDPRDCMKQCLYQKWQKIVAPPENQRPASKRRRRKTSASNTTNGGGATGKKKNNTSISPGPQSFSLASQDVMVVGEPSMMGGEFGDEDERLITRLENTQYDPTVSGVSNGLEDGDDYNSLGRPPGPGQGPAQGPGSVPGPGPGPQGNQGQPHGGPNVPQSGWSGPSGPGSNPGSVSSNPDSRGNNQGGGGPQGSQVDKKPSPLNQ